MLQLPVPAPAMARTSFTLTVAASAALTALKARVKIYQHDVFNQALGGIIITADDITAVGGEVRSSVQTLCIYEKDVGRLDRAALRLGASRNDYASCIVIKFLEHYNESVMHHQRVMSRIRDALRAVRGDYILRNCPPLDEICKGMPLEERDVVHDMLANILCDGLRDTLALDFSGTSVGDTAIVADALSVIIV